MAQNSFDPFEFTQKREREVEEEALHLLNEIERRLEQGQLRHTNYNKQIRERAHSEIQKVEQKKREHDRKESLL